MAKGHNQRPEPAAQPAANPPAADPKAEAPAVEEAKAVTTVEAKPEPAPAPAPAPAPKPKAEPAKPSRVQKGRVKAKAVTTVVVDCMPVQPGETCWVPTEQAKRLAAKGALKLL